MNFYKHHIGDYAAATAHLSWDEDMAYTRLLRAYYQHEKPIPTDRRAVYRLARASSKSQREAVDAVLDEFFVLDDDGWHQKRCDEELAAASELEQARDEKKANERERQQRHRERRKVLFETLREHGIVPKFDTSTESLEAMLSRVTVAAGNGDSNVSERVTGVTGHAPATANQTPDARRQTPDKEQQQVLPTSLGQATGGGTPAGTLAAELNRAGIRCTSQDPRVIEAAEGGITGAEVIELRDRLYPDKPAAYLLRAATSQRAERATGATHATSPRRGKLSLADQSAAESARRNGGDDAIEGEAVRVVG